MAGAQASLVDLAATDEPRRSALLNRFGREIYEPAFPRDEEREDWRIWRGLMAERPPEPMPELHPLLAVGPNEEVQGGFVFELYRRSNTALGTYLAVAPAHRRQGLGGRLVAGAYDILQREAQAARRAAPVFLAESENPARLPPAQSAHGQERLRVLSRLGYLVSDLPYVQPALSPEKTPSELLLLIAYGPSLPPDHTVPAAAMCAYLTEFYDALEAHDAPQQRNLARMNAWLEAQGGLRFKPWADG